MVFLFTGGSINYLCSFFLLQVRKGIDKANGSLLMILICISFVWFGLKSSIMLVTQIGLVNFKFALCVWYHSWLNILCFTKIKKRKMHLTAPISQQLDSVRMDCFHISSLISRSGERNSINKCICRHDASSSSCSPPGPSHAAATDACSHPPVLVDRRPVASQLSKSPPKAVHLADVSTFVMKWSLVFIFFIFVITIPLIVIYRELLNFVILV